MKSKYIKPSWVAVFFDLLIKFPAVGFIRSITIFVRANYPNSFEYRLVNSAHICHERYQASQHKTNHSYYKFELFFSFVIHLHSFLTSA